jgi:glucose-6-phosphate isomerase
MEELELRWKSREYIADWLISFYRERMLYFMNNIGGRTEYNTVITPKLLMITMKRYNQLIEEKHDIDRRLS